MVTGILSDLFNGCASYEDQDEFTVKHDRGTRCHRVNSYNVVLYNDGDTCERSMAQRRLRCWCNLDESIDFTVLLSNNLSPLVGSSCQKPS